MRILIVILSSCILSVFAASFQDLIKSGVSGYGQVGPPPTPAPPQELVLPVTYPPFVPPVIEEQNSSPNFQPVESYFSFPNPQQMQMPPPPGGPLGGQQQPQYYYQTQQVPNWNSNNMQQPPQYPMMQQQQQFPFPPQQQERPQQSQSEGFMFPGSNFGMPQQPFGGPNPQFGQSNQQPSFQGLTPNLQFGQSNQPQSFEGPPPNPQFPQFNNNLGRDSFFPMGIPPVMPDASSLPIPKPSDSQKEYMYDWTMKSPPLAPLANIPLEATNGKGELLQVRNLLATDPPRTLPPMTTTTPASTTLTARPTRPRTTEPPSQNCVPHDAPSSFGFCAPRKANRTPNCGALLASKSDDCHPSDLCCFMFQPPQPQEKSDAPGNRCQSAVDRTKSGFCTPRSERSISCIGLIATASPDCSEQELCCIQPVVIPPKSIALAPGECSPAIKPEVRGFCSRRSERGMRCNGMLSAASPNCEMDELCCFTVDRERTKVNVDKQAPPFGSPSGYAPVMAGSTLAPPPQSVRRCSPANRPEVTNGRCVATVQLASVCRGIQVGYSSNCTIPDMCCFESNALPPPRTPSYPVMTVPPPRSCSPVTRPEVTNGRCVTAAHLPSVCRGIQVGYSGDCSIPDMCCYESDSLQTMPPYTQAPPERNCVPVTNPEVTNGRCVTAAHLPRVCRGIQVASSSDCNIPDMCCFETNIIPTSTPGYATQGTVPPTARPAIPPTSTGASSYGSSGNSSWNPNAPSIPYWLPFTPQYLCTPNDNPNIYDGVCVAQNMAANLCNGLQRSGSLNCAENEYCCYANKNPGPTPPSYTRSPSPPPSSSICSPDHNPSISDGVCVGMNDLERQCNGVSLSASRDCRTDQYCCYRGGNTIPNNTGSGYQTSTMIPSTSTPQIVTTTRMPALCSPQGNSHITNGRCTAFGQISTSCRGIQISPSLNCQWNEYCCFANGPNVDDFPTNGCSPETSPGVRNGTCVRNNEIASRCRGIQVAISRQCGAGTHLCCFGGAVGQVGTTPPPTTLSDATTSTSTTTITTPTRICRPSTRPDASNGRCVSPAQIASSCSGVQIASSNDCEIPDLCCFDSDYMPSTVSYSTAASSTQTSTTTPSATRTTTLGSTGRPRPVCSPNTNPGVTNGRCTRNDQLAAECRGMQISVSGDCGDYQMCCFETNVVPTTTPPSTTTTTRQTSTATSMAPYTARTPGPAYSVSPSSAPERSCSPAGNRNIKDGVCVHSSEMTTRCRGIQISVSLSCLQNEYCCYRAVDVLDVRPGGACIPQGNPKILNGVCVDQSQLNVSCKGVQMATSRNCLTDQFCCYSTDDSYGWQYGGVAKSKVKQRPVGSCKPNALANADDINGICVETIDVMEACKKWQVARSDDCSSSQYCCFSSDKGPERAKLPSGSGRPIALLGNRDRLQLASLAKNKQSLSGNDVTTTAYDNSYDVSVTPETTTRTTPSTTATTTAQYTTPSTTGMPTRGCRPMSYPNLNSGICVSHSMISSTCSALQVSPSLNCFMNEFCCYVAPPVDTKPHIPCRPDARPDIEGGTCYKTDVLSPQCAGRQLGYSRDCQNYGLEFCCFGDGLPLTTPSTTTVRSTTTTQTTTPTTTTSTTRTSTSPPYYSPVQCRPMSQPMVTDGQCVDAGLIAVACSGIQVAESRDCPPETMCCYTSLVVTVPTYATTPTTRTTATTRTTPTTTTSTTTTSPTTTTRATSTTTMSSGYCIPAGEPSVTNGFCVDTGALATRCDGIEFSTSVQCRVSELCCYTHSTTTSYTTAGTTVITTQSSTPSTTLAMNTTRTINYGRQRIRTSVAKKAVPPSFGLTLNQVRVAKSCVPDVSPDVTNGFCVEVTELVSRCAGIQASQSRSCPEKQFCCFDQRIAEKASMLGRTDAVDDELPLVQEAQNANPPDTTTGAFRIVTIPRNWPRFL